jgi:hypothetical protein
MDHCTIRVPEGFRDRTTHVLEWKTEEGDSLALVMQRDPLPAPGASSTGRPLDDYVAATTRDYPSRFAGLRVEIDDEGELAGLQIRRKAFRWKHDAEVLYHCQAFVLAGTHVEIFTVAGKARHRDRIDEIVQIALEDLRYREG